MSRADDLYAKYSTSKRFSTKSTDKDEEKKKQYASKADELYDKYSTSRRFQSSLINTDSGTRKELYRFDTSVETEPAKKTAVNFAQGENRFQTQSNTQPQPSIEKYPYNASKGKATIYAPKSFAEQVPSIVQAEKEFMADGGAKNTLRKRQVQSFIDSTPVFSDPSYKNTLKSLDDEYTSKVNEINSTDYAPRERNFALREAELEYEIKKLNLIETTLIPEEDTEIKISVVPHDIGFGNNARRDQRNTFETNADKKIKEDAARKANPYYDDVQKAGQYKKKLSNELEALRSQRDEEREAVEEGQEIYEKIEDNDVLEIAFKLAAGVENGVVSIGNRIADKDYYAPSSWQIAASLATEDLNQDGVFLPEWLGGGTLGGAIGDAAYSIGNMAPALAAGAAATYLSKGALGAESAAMIGEAAFATTFGASVYGNAYAEAINNGYDKEIAGSYASAIAASEVLSNYYFGGISKVGGKLTNSALKKALDRVSSTALKTAATFTGKVGSEVFEEWGQATIEPILKNIILGESNEIDPLSPEALYSGMLGGFTALVLDGAPSGVSSAANAVRTYRTGKAIKNNTNFDVTNLTNLVKNGSTISADSVAYKIANKVNDKTGAYTIGKLFHSIGAELSVQNKQDIVESLTRKGVAPENAETIADWLGATVNGAKLTKQQINALELNEDIANTFRDVIINPNSTINQRRQAWFEAGGFDVDSNVDADMNAYSPDAVMDRINESQMLTTQSAPSLETQLSQLAQETASKSTEAPSAEKSNPFIPLAKQTKSVQNTEKIKALDSVVAKEHDVSDIEGKTILKNTNEAVNIKKIASIDNNSMKIELDDGRVVSSKDVSYGTQGEALVYETVIDLTADASSANAIVGIFKAAKPSSPRAWLAGATAVYTDGMYNIPYAEISAQNFTDNLSEREKQFLYNLGKKHSKTKANAEENRLKAHKSAIKKTTRKKSKVTLNGKENFNTKGFTDVQRASLSYANVLSEITGVEVRLFESEEVNGRFVYTDENGEVKAAPNGKYIPGSNVIMLDINAGIKGEGTMLYTLSHELTHFIKEWSPAKFNELAEFLMEQYGKQGRSVDELVQAQIRKAKSNGRTIDYDTAYEEVIADSMEAMLADGKVIEKLQQLYKQDKSLYQKIVDFVNKWVDKVKQVYAEYSPDSKEGKLVLKMQESLEEIQSLFAEAIYEASENVTEIKNTAEAVKFSIKDMGFEEFDKQTLNNIKMRRGVVLNSVDELRSHIEIALKNPQAKVNCYLGVISSSVKDKIETNVKQKLFENKQYTFVVSYDDIQHISEHFNTVDKIVQEVLRLYDIIKNYDSVKLEIGKSNTRKLIFDKSYSDYDYRTVEIVSKSKASLDLVTLYVTKNNIKRTQSVPPATQGSLQRGSASKDIISNQEDIVKLSDRYSDIDLNEPALSYFGKTYSWKETGYLLTNGSKLDFSGKHYGASGGYRTVDHRDIWDSFPEDMQDDFDGNEAMVEFMRRGNIRIMPEGDGINLSVLPTEAQEKALADFISRARGEVTLDIDNEYGDTVVSVEYPRGTRSDKVLRDIRQYFKDGTEPVVSHLSRFRYSDRDYSFDPELVADLQADADKLKSDVANLKELLKLQKTVTHGTVFTKTSVNAAASKLMKTFGMNQGKIELASALNEFYQFVASSEDLSWESVMTEASKVADRVIEIVPAREQRNDYSEKILKEIRNKGISLTDEQKAEISSKYGSYNNFRKTHMGSMVLSDKGISLERQWQEWAELYPDVFDKDVTAADMPEALSDIVSDLRLTRKMVKELDTAENRQMMLNEIYDSYWGVSTLHTLADRHQKQVNLLKSKHNSQMSELRAEYKEREKKTAQRYQEMIKRIREYKNRQMEEYKEAVRVSKERMSDQKKRTVMRNKIKKVVNELNQYLLNGTKDKHVMEGMQKAVAEALSIVNMDTVDADARVAKYDALIAEATDPDVIEALTATRDRIQSQGDRLADKLASLKSAYADVINSSDPTLSNAYDEVIEAKIASVVETVGDTSLRNMSMEQLEEVYDLYKMVLTNIRNANKLFASEKQETIEQLGYEVDSEVKTATKQKDRMTAVNSFLRKVGYKDLKPIYFFRMLGSTTMTDLYKKVRDGQGTWFKDAVEARAFRIETERKYNYKQWDLKETYKFTAKSGKSFELTLPQIMSIYAFSRREQAFDHLIKGGIVFDDAVKVKEKKKGVTLSYTVNTSEAFNLSVDTLGEIIDTLTEEQKSYVKDMQSYLSDTMGGKGNEVSLELYGVKLFKEKNYFPLKSSQYYMNFTAEEAGETKIKNSSFSKETVKHANNPIVLSDFIDVWANHVNDMSNYHAFVLPLEDFTRVYNYRTPTSEDVETTSVKSTIHNHYTEAANSYIKQLLKDINGGSVSGVGTEVIDKMVGLAKKGAVFASASVVVQQPSAIARAMAYVNPKYFVNVSSFNFKRHNQLWEECKQYAPVAGIKEMGYFDTSVGRTGIDWLKADEYDSVREKFFAFFKDKEQRRNIFDDALSFAPAMVDELSWAALWEAVKKETRKTTNLEVGSEEFFKHCGERFTEVVDLTQVYDSVFARSELMRSKDRSVKMATSFMAEPTVQANMLFDAVLQLKRGKKSALAPAAATIGAVVGSVVLNSILKSFVLAGRDDDEDETYLEKYVSSFAGDVLSGLNPLTLIPFVKDIISIAQGYSVERMDTSVVEDIIGSIMDLGKDTKSDAEKALGLIGSVANLFGVPAKNIIRDFNSAINVFNTFSRGDKTTGTGIKFALLEGLSETVTANIIKGVTGEGINTNKGKKYYDAVVSGDNDYIQKNKSEESVINSFKDLVKEKVKSGELSVEKGANMLSKYGGVDEEKAFETAQYYDFTAKNPDLAYNWTSTTVAGYLETAEPSGISVEVYDDYLVKKKDCTGTDNDGDGKADSGTKKKEILKVIDSLPITSKQKDTLYLINNWSKSTLYEAPWH